MWHCDKVGGLGEHVTCIRGHATSQSFVETSANISKTVQDKDIVTVEDEHEITRFLSISTNMNDLEWL